MSTLKMQSAVVVRAPLAADRYGNNKPDWTNAVRTTYGGVAVQPQTTSEEIVDRDTTVSRWTLFGPSLSDMDVAATDRIECGGITFEVDGEPLRWSAPGTGAVHHIEITLREVR